MSTGAPSPPSNLLASVIVPTYNEATHLSANLRTLARSLVRMSGPYEYEIIVIDDGSTDETYGAAQSAALEIPGLRVVRHGVNRGLGCAVRTGFAFARGSVAVIFDSDLSYSPEIVHELLAQMESNNDDLVLASPYTRGGVVRNVPFLRKLLSREANRFLSFATNGRYATLTCMVRAYRLSFFRSLDSTEERMEINPELAFKALKAGARVSELPAALEWSSDRAISHAGLSPARTAKQIAVTMRYGIRHRPAVLLALPGIVPGVLPLIVGIAALGHLSLATIATIALVTTIVQNASLALFGGQLVVFARNLLRLPRFDDSANQR